MRRLSNTDCYKRLTTSQCYEDTVSRKDKAKVEKARAGINPTTPASKIGQVAAELGLRAHADDASTIPPDPPDPPKPTVVAPRTFNKVLPDGSDARFCVRDLPTHNGLPYDDYTVYDVNGLDKNGGRDPNYQVPGLRQANSMDQYGPCDLYPPLTEWPPESYLR